MAFSAFFNTEVSPVNTLEAAGNFCLSPVRTLFGGRSFTIVDDKIVEWKQPKQKVIERILMIALSIILLIPGVIVGSILKGVALISKPEKERHLDIIEYIKTTPKHEPKEVDDEEDLDEDSTESYSTNEEDYERTFRLDSMNRVADTHFGNIHVVLKRGDITKEHCDVVVNAANEALVKGGGVDDAIHKAAGPTVQAECLRHPKIDGLRCPPGEVRVTGSGELPAKKIFHTVGPRWRGGAKNEKAVLQKCYFNCIKEAVTKGHRSIAFPSISTGVFGYPLEQAAKDALESIRDTVNILGPSASIEVRFILFSENDMTAYTKALEKAKRVSQEGLAVV